MSRNEELFARAQRTIPAGVNSPVRAFRSVGGTPRFFTRGEGAVPLGRRRQALHRLRRLVGPGDRRPRASGRRARGAGSRRARPVVRRADRGRDRDGGDAVRRLPVHRDGAPGLLGHRGDDDGAAPRARLHRPRKIVKFEGCYHGHGDSLLVKAGSGALTFGQPSSAGVPPAIANETLVLAYNDLDAVEAAFASGRRRHRLRHRRAGRRQHEPDRADARLPARACASCATGTARC